MDKDVKKNRGIFFRGYKNLIKIGKKKPKFIHLGDEPSKQSLIVSNHVGTSAPLAYELYYNKRIRFWGAHEMNSGLVNLYKYQTKVYYHEKKHWNIFGARMFCLLASPLTNFFYKGLRLISTYPDMRFKHTLEESYDAILDNQNIVIFPENSTKGYLDELEGFHAGFVVMAEYAYKRGIDVPIYVSYYRKKTNTYVIDKPVMYSSLKDKYSTKEEIADALRLRCNELGKMDLSSY